MLDRLRRGPALRFCLQCMQAAEILMQRDEMLSGAVNVLVG